MLYSSRSDRKLGWAGLIMWVGDSMGPVCQEDMNVAHPPTVPSLSGTYDCCTSSNCARC